MPYGLPAAITLSRYEWAFDLDRKDEDGSPQATVIPEGTVIMPQYKLADHDGEWLCTDRNGKRLAILEEKLRLSVAS
jgi:hypothetical protein